MEPLGGRGEGAGGFISIAPRCGAPEGTAAALAGGEGTVAFPFPPLRVLEGGVGERDLDRES